MSYYLVESADQIRLGWFLLGQNFFLPCEGTRLPTTYTSSPTSSVRIPCFLLLKRSPRFILVQHPAHLLHTAKELTLSVSAMLCNKCSLIHLLCQCLLFASTQLEAKIGRLCEFDIFRDHGVLPLRFGNGRGSAIEFSLHPEVPNRGHEPFINKRIWGFFSRSRNAPLRLSGLGNQTLSRLFPSIPSCTF